MTIYQQLRSGLGRLSGLGEHYLQKMTAIDIIFNLQKSAKQYGLPQIRARGHYVPD